MSTGPDADSSSPRPTHRIGWIDDARGLGILLVVVGHVIRGLRSSEILSDSAACRFTDAWIYAFHMPLFFILSGLFAEKKTERDGLAFLVEQTATIVYPYFLWSFLQTGLQMAMSGSVNRQLGPRDLLAIPWAPVMQFWFLYALFLIAVAHHGLRRLGLRPPSIAAIFAGAWGVVNFARRFWPPWYPLGAAASNGIYYAIGAVWNRGGRALSLSVPPAVAALIVMVGYGLVTAWTAAGGASAPPALAAPFGNLAVALAGSAATLALATLTVRTAATRVLGPCGRASLAIFVTHTIFSAAIRVALVKVFKIHSPAIHLAAGIIGGVLPSIPLVYFAERWKFPYLFRWPTRRPATAACP